MIKLLAVDMDGTCLDGRSRMSAKIWRHCAGRLRRAFWWCPPPGAAFPACRTGCAARSFFVM